MAALATTSAGMRPSEVSAAARELSRMRRALAGWMKYRLRNDQVAAGKVASKYPPRLAAKIIENERDWAVEQKLANHLEALLAEVMPGADLPDPNVRQNPNAAAELAMIALYPEKASQSSAETTGAWALPVVPWPILIVGAIAVVLLVTITTAADVAKEKERMACIRAGACTDYGFWVKWAAIAALGWFAWEKAGVGAAVKRRLAGGKGPEGTTT